MNSTRDYDIKNFNTKREFWQFHSDQWELSGLVQEAYRQNAERCQALHLTQATHWYQAASAQGHSQARLVQGYWRWQFLS